MINVVIAEGLYDKEFVERWCIGFDALAARAAEYPLDRVADITWLPAEQIREAAFLYAATKPAVLHHRVAMDQNITSTQATRAMIDLVAITGNIDVEGGNLLPPKIEGLLPDRHPVRRGCVCTAAGGGTASPWSGPVPLASSPKGRFCGGPTLMFVHPALAMQAMEGSGPYPLKAMYCSGGNPLINTMDVRRFAEALRKLDLLVVADYFMTPTAELADYVLPATTWLERDEALR